MSKNIIEQFTSEQFATAKKIRELRTMLGQLKSQQAPTVRFTPVSTIQFLAGDPLLPTNPNATDQYNDVIHNVIFTLLPPAQQVLFAMPEIDVFECLIETPTITSEYLYPFSGNVNNIPQFFDLSVWYDYYKSDDKDIVAKIFMRNRLFTEFSDAWGPTYAILAARWRYITPGAST